MQTIEAVYHVDYRKTEASITPSYSAPAGNLRYLLFITAACPVAVFIALMIELIESNRSVFT